MMHFRCRDTLLVTLVLLAALPLAAQISDLNAVVHRDESEMAPVIERVTSDARALARRYDTTLSTPTRERWRQFYSGWRDALSEVDFDSLSVEGRIDYVLLAKRIDYELREIDREEKRFDEASPLLPFAWAINSLQESRRRFESVDPAKAAKSLDGIRQSVEETKKALEKALVDTSLKASTVPSKTVANRAAGMLDDLAAILADWHGFYDGYDPEFTWWTREPYASTKKALDDYAKFLRERIVGEKEGEDTPIIGDPAGREALMADLAVAMIPYTPEQLIAIGEREFAWCDREMKKAATELGYDDWHDALEHVKTLHVEPGKQPDLVRDLAAEAIDFVEKRDLLTVPPLAVEIWRMTMMSPERQKVAPFFLGGEEVQVSYPTDTMTDEQKLMSMRGNNRHFSRATVFHELIPGHHLQGFMNERYMSHREVFWTPFWTEGWALYWEMRLWDMEYPRTPEDRIGMLFWRMHRCARIVFSLKFHLGEMTPQQAIDYLVERVGHERDNATAEVRRSFEGTYPPLYQLAYMMGALQFRALHDELVGDGTMTERAFHDAILRGGNMPVEMVRARLRGEKIERDHRTHWTFAGEVSTK